MHKIKKRENFAMQTNTSVTSAVKQFLDDQLNKGRTLEHISNEEIVAHLLSRHPHLPHKTTREISAYKANYKRRNTHQANEASQINKVSPNSLECTLNVRISKEREVKVIFDKEPKVGDIDRLIQYLEMIKEDFTDEKASKTFSVPF
jgi:hypothetical protein